MSAAIALYEKEFRQHPQNGQNAYRYAQLLSRHGQAPELRRKGLSLLEQRRARAAETEKLNLFIFDAAKDRKSLKPRRILARYCERTNRLPRAILEWEEILLLSPKDAEATESVTRLKRRRGDLPEGPRANSGEARERMATHRL